MERKLVLKSCLKRDRWGLLEMYILLTDDIVELDMCTEYWNLDKCREKLSPTINIKLDHERYHHLFFFLLMARCPVSNNRSRELPLIRNIY